MSHSAKIRHRVHRGGGSFQFKAQGLLPGRLKLLFTSATLTTTVRHHDAIHKIDHADTVGLTHLDLTSMGLTRIPEEILDLQSLETLDLSGNQLSELPDFLAGLKNLKRLFLTKNRFDTWPQVVNHLPSLELFSLKGNQLTGLPRDLPAWPGLKWLILTDNRLGVLPQNFGQVFPALRKLALAHNCLTRLPASFSQLHGLELLRLGMNHLTHLPRELETLPLLTWLGLGGNPFCQGRGRQAEAQEKLEVCRLDPAAYPLEEVLGSGASGRVYGSTDSTGARYAIKVFKETGNDGKSEDELEVGAIAASGPGIIPFRGWFPRPGLAMVMDCIEDAAPLGLVPSFQSITRDTYPPGIRFTTSWIRKTLVTLARAQVHLMQAGVIHGDFYAHNILIDPAGQPWMGDWGASFFMAEADAWMQKMEVRAFGCLVEELGERCPDFPPDLAALRDRCLSRDPAHRPCFERILADLHG